MSFNECLAVYTEKHLKAGGSKSPQELDSLYLTCLGIFQREGIEGLESFVTQEFEKPKKYIRIVGYSY